MGGPCERFIFSYDSGEWDLFEIAREMGSKRKFVSLIETDKTREHEEPLTAIDYH